MNNIWLSIEQWCNNLGFGALLFTFVMYLIEFNFSEAGTEKIEVLNGTEGPFQGGTAKRPVRTGTLANQSMILSNILIAAVLGARWIESGHFPLSNLYESLMFLSWTTTFIHLAFSYALPLPSFRFRQGGSSEEPEEESPEAMRQFKWLGMITTPAALMFNGFASFSLPDEMRLSGPLVPALQSNWLMMHVTLMILSYATLILGSLIAIIFLVVSESAPPLPPSSVPSYGGRQEPPKDKDFLAGLPIPAEQEGPREEKSITESLDNISYRLVGLGFPLLTIGIISGAVWANEAWGSYWSWDPKETWALITWLTFAIYLHTRLNKGWEGKKAAYVAAVGFIIIWICYLGVNLLGNGLHSYGFLQ